MTQRIEKDSLGEIQVPGDKLWGAQTQRSLHYFNIGRDLMPREMIESYALVKRACAHANSQQGKLSPEKKDLIFTICDEIMSGLHQHMFPLHVWMTGSGTQFNMNVNEVIANRASQLTGKKLGSKIPLHPNDHVNMSQSTNDTFPTAMHIAAALNIHRHLLPALQRLKEAFAQKSKQWAHIVKVGRTHLQDAVPMSVGQEWYGFQGLIEENILRIQQAFDALLPLTLGGTALGTGVNTEKGFAEKACAEIARLTRLNFKNGENKFALQSAHDSLVHLSSCLKTLAGSLFKIAQDIRLLACGPRAGLGEIELPTNEPGSSIMPGKINPTQVEALTMICFQVMGNDLATSLGGSGGMLNMNAYKPLMIHNIMQSLNLLHDGMENFRKFLIEGTKLHEAHIEKSLNHSLILVTALSPAIGYDKASEVAHYAMEHDLSPRQAALSLGFMTEEDYDRLAQPHSMLNPSSPSSLKERK